MPAAAARSARAGCTSGGTANETASTSARKASKSSWTTLPYVAATAAAASWSRPQTAARVAPRRRRCLRRGSLSPSTPCRRGRTGAWRCRASSSSSSIVAQAGHWRDSQASWAGRRSRPGRHGRRGRGLDGHRSPPAGSVGVSSPGLTWMFVRSASVMSRASPNTRTRAWRKATSQGRSSAGPSASSRPGGAEPRDPARWPVPRARMPRSRGGSRPRAPRSPRAREAGGGRRRAAGPRARPGRRLRPGPRLGPAGTRRPPAPGRRPARRTRSGTTSARCPRTGRRPRRRRRRRPRGWRPPRPPPGRTSAGSREVGRDRGERDPRRLDELHAGWRRSRVATLASRGSRPRYGPTCSSQPMATSLTG